ncbi:hypothetical protein ACJA88_008395 [Fusarium oxysporum]
MSAIASYTYGNFLWLSTQALPLIVWPSFVGSLLRPGNETSTSWALLQLLAIVSANNSLALETYFGRSLGLALLALGLTVVKPPKARRLPTLPLRSSYPPSTTLRPPFTATVAIPGLEKRGFYWAV